MRLVLDDWWSSDYIQELETRHKWVLADNKASQQWPVRSGSCELLVWLWDLGIQLTDGSLHFLVSMPMIAGDSVLLQLTHGESLLSSSYGEVDC